MKIINRFLVNHFFTQALLVRKGAKKSIIAGKIGLPFKRNRNQIEIIQNSLLVALQFGTKSCIVFSNVYKNNLNMPTCTSYRRARLLPVWVPVSRFPRCNGTTRTPIQFPRNGLSQTDWIQCRSHSN